MPPAQRFWRSCALICQHPMPSTGMAAATCMLSVETHGGAERSLACTSIRQNPKGAEASQYDFRCILCAGTRSEMLRWICGASQSLEHAASRVDRLFGTHGGRANQHTKKVFSE